MLGVLFVILVLYMLIGTVGLIFRIGWGIMKGLFGLGLFFLLPVFVILSLAAGLISVSWPVLLVILLAFMAGRRAR